MSAIFPVNNLINRSEKRKYKIQALKVAPVLEEINTGFIWHIFNADPSMHYNEIYKHYAREWNDTVDRLAATKIFPCVAIDRLFFERNYKPELFIK